MDTEKMINMALAYKGMSQAELARNLGTTSSNFNQKVKRDTFSREELEKIAVVLGGEYKSCFLFPDGTKIGG
jgi:transcriptional regulator